MPSIAQRATVGQGRGDGGSFVASASAATAATASVHLLPEEAHTAGALPGKRAVLSRRLWQSVVWEETASAAKTKTTIAVSFPPQYTPTSSSSSSSSPSDLTWLYTAECGPEDTNGEAGPDEDLSASDIWLSSVPPPYTRNLAMAEELTVHVQAYEPIPLSSVILSTSDEQLLSDGGVGATINGVLARQGEVLRLPRPSSSSSPSLVRVVQTEPVVQGVITAKTDVLLAYQEGVGEDEGDEGDGNGDGADVDDVAALADTAGDEFAIDEQFLAHSVLQTFSDSDEEGADKSLQGNATTTAAPSSSSLSQTQTFTSMPIQNRQALVHAIDVWRKHQEDVSTGVDEESAVLVSERGLGSIGAFHGDWAIAQLTGHDDRSRLVRLFSYASDTRVTSSTSPTAYLPPQLLQNLHSRGRFDPLSNPALSPLRLTPLRARNTLRSPRDHHPLGCPLPIPFADSLTIARVPSALSVNRTYQALFLDALRRYFEGKQRIMREGDVIAVGVDRGRVRWVEKSKSSSGKGEAGGEGEQQPPNQQSTSGDDPSADVEPSRYDFNDVATTTTTTAPSGVVHFCITSLTSELSDPSKPAESPNDDDTAAALVVAASSANLGAVVDASLTKMIQTGVAHSRVIDSTAWLGVISSATSPPLPLDAGATPLTRPSSAFGTLCQLIQATLMPRAASYGLHLSVLLKGARGSGKKTAIRWSAARTGVHLVEVNCFDILGDSDTQTEGVLRARFESAASCGPAVLVLYNIDALARKSQAVETGQEPAMSNVLRDCIHKLKSGGAASIDASSPPPSPVAIFATTSDADKCPDGILACFKHEVVIEAPNESERAEILAAAASGSRLNPDVSLKDVATQTAALAAADLVDLVARARLASVERVKAAAHNQGEDTAAGGAPTRLGIAGVALTGADFDVALSKARSNYSESIGAPKIPNVTWDDVGGLASVKSDILDTIQLPLEHPELFADGLKKRSGILLYGPPGTGKTLLAKAVATSCSLNFFSVKGPELLNMYIGESEANVRRVFQRARDAKPCVIFFDELDSVAPKRGNQGDSGGVMDRIVSQLLAELDGMAGSKEGTDVFVIGATNRPDLLDPALLRPGRFDRMLYLSVSETHAAQLNILQALTRKFKLDADVGDLACIADQCPFNLTGADFYALCSDAMLKAMTRKASEVDEHIAAINASPPVPNPHPHPMTPQYYLSELASPDEIQVKVSRADFEGALNELVPSVSEQEMSHYRRVQAQFSGPPKKDNEQAPEVDGYHIAEQAGGTIQDLAEQIASINGTATPRDAAKGKGKARAVDVDAEDDPSGVFHPAVEAPRPSASTNGLVPPISAVEAGGSAQPVNGSERQSGGGGGGGDEGRDSTSNQAVESSNGHVSKDGGSAISADGGSGNLNGNAKGKGKGKAKNNKGKGKANA